jgi:hypothetical protein
MIRTQICYLTAIDVAVHPQGTSYCNGGEDGYVRLHHFDRSYQDFLYEVEREPVQTNLSAMLSTVKA